MSRKLVTASWVAPSGDAACLEEVETFCPDADARTGKVSFTVGPQSFLFLVGPPGSGKSAILDLLCFHVLTARGRATVLGVDPARLASSERARMRRRVGMMFQDQRLLPDLNVFDNVAIAVRIAERNPRDYADRIGELLIWVGLAGRREERLSRLTAGERRRLCLARALVNQPELLVIDDATAGLSGRAEQGLLRLIADVNAAGTPVVFATRDRSLALAAGGSIYDMPARDIS